MISKAVPSAAVSAERPTLLGQFTGLLQKLHSIEVGGSKRSETNRIKPAQLIELLRLLLMLLENGLSLPKALASLAADRSTRRHRGVLNKLRGTIEAGGLISDAMEDFPSTFTAMQVQQVRIGERSGSLEEALRQVCDQLEHKVALRKRVIKKISYPILITVAGSGLMIFMCTFVVPEFENVYASSGVELPAITRFVTGTSRQVMTWGWLAFPTVILLALGWRMSRTKHKIALAIDAALLRIPIVGPWIRDVAVLQFAEATSSMVECGYNPVDAVQVASECVRNRAVRAAVEDIKRGVRRGERLSTELERYDHFFSATLCQLVGVGEQSGDFAKAMRGTCEHLRERLETRIDATVGMLEPVLTILLAIAIGGIVLSIYTPMFHMFEVLE